MVDVGNPVDQPDDLPFERCRLTLAGVVQDAVLHFLGQVETAPVALEDLDDAERLLVVAKTAAEAFLEDAVKRLLPRVPERRMAEIVAKSDRLGQVLVEAESACDRP